MIIYLLLALFSSSFNNMQIYPTPTFKRKHVDAIFKDRLVENFYFFDDELHILKDLEKGYPGKANIFHTPKGLFYETFKQNNSQKASANC